MSALAKVIVRDETTKDSDVLAPLYECNLMRNVSGLKIKRKNQWGMSDELEFQCVICICVVLGCITSAQIYVVILGYEYCNCAKGVIWIEN